MHRDDLDERWDHAELAAVWWHVPAPSGALVDARALLVDHLGAYELPRWTGVDEDSARTALTITDEGLIEDLRAPDDWEHLSRYSDDVDARWRTVFPPAAPTGPELAQRLLEVQHELGTRLTVWLAHDGGGVRDVAVSRPSTVLEELLTAVLGVPGMRHGDLADEGYRRWLELLERTALRLAALDPPLEDLAEQLWPRPHAPVAEERDDAEVPLDADDRDVRQLRKLWAQLAELEREPASGHRRWNRLGDEMSEVRERLLARAGGLAAVQRIAVEHPDPFVRRWARDATRYPDPNPTTAESLAAWLRHPFVGLDELVEEVRPALLLQVEPVPAEVDGDVIAQVRDRLDVGPVSWLGGPPLGPLLSWPRRDDDIALVHVAQLDLRAVQLTRQDQPGDWPAFDALPSEGVIQVFHDLETPGDDPAEGARDAWLVRWVEAPTEPVEPPRDAHGPTPAFAPLHAMAHATIPELEDVPEHLRERVVVAHERLVAALDPSDHPRPPSLVLGHGWSPEGEALDWLDGIDGRSEAGSWVLLFDFAGVGALEGWFGDEGHLEIWIRRDDLVAHRFEAAWALLR